jgi:hypothetical protein
LSSTVLAGWTVKSLKGGQRKGTGKGQRGKKEEGQDSMCCHPCVLLRRDKTTVDCQVSEPTMSGNPLVAQHLLDRNHMLHRTFKAFLDSSTPHSVSEHTGGSHYRSAVCTAPSFFFSSFLKIF